MPRVDDGEGRIVYAPDYATDREGESTVNWQAGTPSDEAAARVKIVRQGSGFPEPRAEVEDRRDGALPPIAVDPELAERLTRAVDGVRASIEADLAADSKPTNPKDLIGSTKLPLHLWPETATVGGCIALLEGALKYGRSNWREAGVRATIYTDACKRHINAWLEGEEVAPDSGLPHLWHALACLAIIEDAKAADNLVDDRMYPGGYHAAVEAATPHVERLKAKYADRDPKHWTIEDAEPDA